HCSTTACPALTAYNCRVLSRLKADENGRFAHVLRSQVRRNLPRIRRALPIIITGNLTTGIMQAEHWVLYWPNYIEAGQAGTNRSNQYLFWRCAANNKATDHHLVSGLDEPASGNITQVQRRTIGCNYRLKSIHR